MIDDAVCRVLNFILTARRYGANPAPRSQKYVPSKNTTNQNKNKIKKRNICIQPTLCVFYLSVTYFQFQFSFFVCFHYQFPILRFEASVKE